MSNELFIPTGVVASGGSPGAIVWGQNRTQRWNGSAMVATSTIMSSAWSNGVVSLSEQMTGDTPTPLGTARYVGSFPSGITTPGEYEIEYFSTATPAYNATPVGTSTVPWSGSAMVSAAAATVGGYATGEDPATLLLVTPANKLATNSGGQVTAASVAGAVGSVTTAVSVSGSVTVGGYASGQDPATLLAAAGYTAARAGYLDLLESNLDAQVSTRSQVSDVTGVWTTAMTEAYAANSSAMTPAEALYMIYSVCAQFAVTGTSIVAKKLDGTTTALTFTMDSAIAPTERSRSG